MSRLLSGIVCTLCLGAGLRAATITVPVDQPTIQDAINAATAGDVIQVQAGTYTENLLLAAPGKDVVIESLDGPETTIIQSAAVNDRPVIEIQAGHTSATVIQGFTITGANHTTPGVDAVAAQGGGIEVRDADPTIRGNWITANACPGGGAGVFLYQSNSIVEKNAIYGNSGDLGAGIRCEAATDGVYAPTIRNNDIYGNTATTTGGGVEVLNLGAMSFAGNTVQGNSAPTGGGLNVAGGSATMAIVDSIFWGNGLSNLSGVIAAMITYCDIENDGGLAGVGGNINSDPLFVDALTGDLRLGTGSPCIDAGIAAAGLTEDIEGNARDATPDMGAHEVVPVPAPTGLICSVTDLDVSLSWSNGGTYDSIVIRRNSVDYQTLAGTETTFVDLDVLPGSYTYDVLGEVGTHLSPAASCSPNVPVPSVTGLSCDPGDGQVSLSWTNQYTYDSIEIYRDGGGTPLATLAGTDTSHVDSPVTVGSHTYDLVAVYSGQSSAPTSCAVDVVVLPVEGLSCVQSGTLDTVDLSWTNGGTYTAVEIHLDGVLSATLAGTATSHSAAGIGYGSHTFDVYGVIDPDKSTATSCTETLVVPAPTMQICQAATDSLTVDLGWSNPLGVTYSTVNVYRNGIQIDTVGGDTTSYSDTTLTVGGTYTYGVAGVADGEVSAQDTCDVTTTFVAPVTGLTCAQVGNTDTVQMDWTNGTTYESVKILVDGVLDTTLAGTATSHTTGSIQYGAHTLSVIGVEAGVDSAPATCNVTLDVPAPSFTSCVPASDSLDVVLTWSDPITYSEVRVYRDGGLLATLTAGETTYTDSSLTAGGSYTYELEGQADGELSTKSSCIATTTFVAPVTGLTCAQVGDTDTVQLDWTNGTTYDSVRIERDAGTVVETVTGSPVTYTTGGIQYGAHTLSVIGIQGVQESAPATCNVTLLVPAPTFGSCVPASDSLDVVLTWSDPITYSEVRVYRDGGLLATLTAGETTYTDSSLTAGGSYTYELEGQADGELSTKSSCIATTTFVAPVTGLTCAQVGDTDTVQLDWTNGTTYESVKILVDDVLDTTLAGTATSHTTGSIAYGAHTLSVIGVEAGVDSAPATCNVTLVVPAPQFTSCDPATDSLDVALIWSNPIAYDEVRVYRDGGLLSTLIAGETMYTDTTLTVPGTYTYALEGFVDGELSVQSTCQANPTYVPPVSGLTCTQEGVTDTVRLDWTNGGSYDSVRIERDGAVEATLTLGETTYTTASIGYGPHDFAVYGVQGGVDSAPATCSPTLLVPSATITSCTVASDSLDVTVNWTNPTTYDEIRVYRDTGLIATVGGTDVTYTDTTLTTPGTYTYAVEGVADGELAPQDTCQAASTFVPPVTGISCAQVGTTDTVTLSWTNGGTYDSVRIERDGALEATLGGTVATYTTASIQYGAHSFVVYGVQAGVDSAGTSCDVTLLVPAVTILSCNAATDSLDVTVTWLNPITYDEIRVYRDAGLIATIAGTETTYTDSSLTLPGTYTYAIEGVADSELAPQDTCQATSNYVPPVTGLTCAQVTDTDTAQLSWTNGTTYDSVKILVDGAEDATLSGSPITHTTGSILYGAHTLSVIGVQAGAESAPATCDVTLQVPAPTFTSCLAATDGLTVDLQWTNPTSATYSEIRIYRDGAQIALRGGTETSYSDALPVAGTYTYAVEGVADLQVSDQATCQSTSDFVPPVANLLCEEAAGQTVTLTWDNAGTYEALRIERDGALEATLLGQPSSYTTGVLTYGAHDFNVIAIADVAGAVESAPQSCSVTLDVPPPAFSTCTAATDALVANLSWTNAIAYQEVLLYRGGALIATLGGTDTVYADALPAPGTYDYAVEGVADGVTSTQSTCQVVTTFVPPVTITQCTIDPDRVASLLWDNGTPGYEGIEVLIDGVAVVESPLAGDAVSYTSSPLDPGPHTFTVRPFFGAQVAADAVCSSDATLPPPTGVTCVPRVDAWAVDLSWTNGYAYETVTIFRNGVLVATLGGATESYTDPLAGPGSYDYQLVGTLGSLETTPVPCGPADVTYVPIPQLTSCTLTGAEATLSWENLVTYDQIIVSRDGTTIATLGGAETSYSETLGSVGPRVYEVSGVITGFPASTPATCTLTVEAPPPVSGLVCDVAGNDITLTWNNGAADYSAIEIRRNGTILDVVDGSLTSYVDPALPLGVYSYGLRPLYGLISAETTATCQVDMSLQGPENLVCELTDVLAVTLSWTNTDSYTTIQVHRDGELIAILPGTAITFNTVLPDAGTFLFEVNGTTSTSGSTVASCTVDSTITEILFKRGDSNADGSMNIADAIFSLNYSFRAGTPPPCLASADTNGDDRVDISDAIWSVNYLFLGGEQPPAPFPFCGPLPEGSTLSCDSFPSCPTGTP